MIKLQLVLIMSILYISTSAKGIALIIGLNNVSPGHYAGWNGALNAPENDARAIAKLAVSQGYDTTMLLTSQANTANVMNAIIAAANELEEGDMFLLYYSGHGGSVWDYFSSTIDEDDEFDETWCLFDGHLFDDRINQLLKRFKKGVKVIVISDSCHSGSVVKYLSSPAMFNKMTVDFYNPMEKSIPDAVFFKTYFTNKDYYDNILCELSIAKSLYTDLNDEYYGLLLAACQDGQKALDGRVNSNFTENLLLVWNNGSYKGGYRAFFDAISDTIKWQTPNYFPFGTTNNEFDTLQPFMLTKPH